MPIDIKVIAPSSKLGNIDDIIEKAKISLAKEGVNLIYRLDIFSAPELPFFSARKDIREKDLKESIISQEYSIIWAARGGYGAGNLVQDCTSLVPPRDKTAIGFSDFTAIHILFNQHYNLPTIHAGGISSYVKYNSSFEDYRSILSGAEKRYKLQQMNNISSSSIEGDVIGGNLTVICSLIGTRLNMNFEGKILLLEEVGEKGYRIHRELMHLKNAGILNGIRAIIFADFTESDETLEEAINHFANNEVFIPCYKTVNIGHGPINLPIVLGSKSYIEGNQLTFTSPFKYNV